MGSKRRNRVGFLVALTFGVSLFVSYSTMHYIKVNHNHTERLLNSFYQKNGNAFYLSSTYSNFSTVWTYEEDRAVVYRLQNGRIRQKLSFNGIEPFQFGSLIPENLEKELYQDCPMVLDGDMFGFIIDIDHIRHKDDYPVDISCMKRGNYDSVVIMRLVNDIKSYHLWEVEY